MLESGMRATVAAGGPYAAQPRGLSLVAFALRAGEGSLHI